MAASKKLGDLKVKDIEAALDVEDAALGQIHRAVSKQINRLQVEERMMALLLEKLKREQAGDGCDTEAPQQQQQQEQQQQREGQEGAAEMEDSGAEEEGPSAMEISQGGDSNGGGRELTAAQTERRQVLKALKPSSRR